MSENATNLGLIAAPPEPLKENHRIVVLVGIAPGDNPAPSYRVLKEALFRKWIDKEVYSDCLTLAQFDAALEADGFSAWPAWEDVIRALVFTTEARFDIVDVQAFTV